ncbi:MAG: aryl-sulfate sulfotransferase, partial [Chloroflexi bacterium]|nr:aryl-sulfate sulfotransferase [Chloroflexota bacterium]
RSTGKFTWKWGPGQISHQHSPVYLDNGHVLIFDNGSHHGRIATYSRVIEVDPSDNRIAWDYTGDPPLSFYSSNIGNAERLPNGNTLICEGAPGRIFEVTAAKHIVWEYINPFGIMTGDGIVTSNANDVYRAHRYGPDHPALQGKDLDPARYGNLNRLYAKPG